MKYEIVGVQHKEGVFKADNGASYAYDNFNLHTMRKSNSVQGMAVAVLKVKAEMLGELIAEVGSRAEDLIGHIVDAEENRFGKVVAIELADTE